MKKSDQKQTPVEFHFENKKHGYRVPKKALLAFAVAIYRKEKVEKVKKTQVVFCSNKTIHDLNLSYRKKDKPTDVLSFTFDEPDLLGEIYISLEQAQLQTTEYETSFSDEICRLFIHGLLHLIGYDHIKIKDRTIMETVERTYLP